MDVCFAEFRGVQAATTVANNFQYLFCKDPRWYMSLSLFSATSYLLFKYASNRGRGFHQWRSQGLGKRGLWRVTPVIQIIAKDEVLSRLRWTVSTKVKSLMPA